MSSLRLLDHLIGIRVLKIAGLVGLLSLCSMGPGSGAASAHHGNGNECANDGNIVDVWKLEVTGGPVQFHKLIFNSDNQVRSTQVENAYPDVDVANGEGKYTQQGNIVTGSFDSEQYTKGNPSFYAGHGTVEFSLVVQGKTFTSQNVTVTIYDPNNNVIVVNHPTWKGMRYAL